MGDKMYRRNASYSNAAMNRNELVLSEGTTRPAGFIRTFVIVLAAVVLAGLLAAISPSAVSAAPPVPGTPVPDSTDLQNTLTIDDTSVSWLFDVSVGGSGSRKVNLVVERSLAGSGDWSHASNLYPYYSGQRDAGPGVTQVTFTVPKRSFQLGYDYRLRATQWVTGQGGDPSDWSGWLQLSTSPTGTAPVAPYPTTPRGPTPPVGNILRADDSALPSSSNSPIDDYEFEIRQIHDPFQAGVDDVTLWTETVPYAGAGQLTQVTVDTCQSIPGCTGTGQLYPPATNAGELRWRVRSIDDAGQTSDWSRWRYFDTRDSQSDFWYIPNRAGSYQAGPAGGDEASGLSRRRTTPTCTGSSETQATTKTGQSSTPSKSTPPQAASQISTATSPKNSPSPEP